MQRMTCESRIHPATVPEADPSYVGSVTVDPMPTEAADLPESERLRAQSH